MALATGSAEACALVRPASRRFYVHVDSLGFLVAAQPTFFGEVAHALALSGASRAIDQVVEDWTFFAPGDVSQSLTEAASTLHTMAADALRTAFQCIVQLVPPRFGATELLLGENEQINAWCYEDGYLTYATDEDAAAIMYTETGSLRRLRSEIRRSPDFDPSLEMISGHSLFLFDQREGTGPGTALFYKKHSKRLLRGFSPATLPAFEDLQVAHDIGQCVNSSLPTFEGNKALESCLLRAEQMVRVLLRSLPATQVPV